VRVVYKGIQRLGPQIRGKVIKKMVRKAEIQVIAIRMERESWSSARPKGSEKLSVKIRMEVIQNPAPEQPVEIVNESRI
jgi:hypothetical protein